MFTQGMIATAQVLLQRPVGLSALGEFAIREGNRGLSLLLAGDLRLMRPYGLTIHPNVIGGYFAFALPVCIGWLFRRQVARRLTSWILIWACLAVGWWALLITFSRSALGGCLVGLGALASGWLRWPEQRPAGRQILALGGTLLTVAILYVILYSPFVIARAGVGGEVTELRSVADRRIFTEIALDLIGRKPITGVGIGNFRAAAVGWLRANPQYALRPDHVHSVPLLIASELGLPGLILWGGLVGWSAWRLWRSVPAPFASGLWAGGAALLAIGLLDHYPWTIFHFGLLSWVGITAGSVYEAPSRPSAQSGH
jgi:O-antigen ligase